MVLLVMESWTRVCEQGYIDSISRDGVDAQYVQLSKNPKTDGHKAPIVYRGPKKNHRLNKLDSSMLKSKNQVSLFVNYGYNTFYDLQFFQKYI